ncbi:MAG: hypothetical protein ACTHN3_04050 [Solirubrobacterales bacterium]
MKPGNRETIPTISEVVREAAAIVDPDGADDAITAFFESFEDDDRPTTATEDLRGVLFSTVEGIDPEGDDPAALAAAAAAFWLATNPSQADNGDHVLREGTRLAFRGDPPEQLSEWLSARGVEL